LQNGSSASEFDMDDDKTYLHTVIHIRDGFETLESVSELERTRMQIILKYLKVEKLNILKGFGRTKTKKYFKE
jgi:ATP-dependent DNA helicase RecG